MPSKQLEKGRIVSISEAARYAGVSRWTVRAWVEQGKIPYVSYPGRKPDRDFRGMKVDLKDLESFIERHKDRNV